MLGSGWWYDVVPMNTSRDRPRLGARVALQDDACFVCGPSNPIGLHLEFERDIENRRATSRVTFAKEHQGWDGVVHGGILAAVLDDVMAYAIMTTDNLPITTRISVMYRKPVRVGETMALEGIVVEIRPRVAQARGIIYPADGGEGARQDIRCEAEGIYYLDAPKAVT
jgi:acyl-coenzyme A thioesterase PaaI-like protein